MCLKLLRFGSLFTRFGVAKLDIRGTPGYEVSKVPTNYNCCDRHASYRYPGSASLSHAQSIGRETWQYEQKICFYLPQIPWDLGVGS